MEKQQNVAGYIPAKTPTILYGLVCLLFVGASMSSVRVEAMNLIDQSVDQSNSKVTLAVIENPELVARVLDNLLRSIVYSASIDAQPTFNGAQKRGLDLGISRGYSGSQAGKHLMGLSAASFANGPGKR